ncbi:hypothetical protein [Hamadaea tsunoensis]|uniref:hypothetical protein n=1 Tax=Hamadaea tsunoensis TaxID=53368 RepID=UPI00041D9932|nr:hypothetical protein [Hamadaea tsunoensis]
MLLELDEEVFADADGHNAFLVLTLLSFTIDGRHDWYPPPAVLDSAIRYLEENAPKLLHTWRELLRNAATAGVWQAARPRPPVTVTAANLDALAHDLGRPAVVVVENSRNDGSFLRALFQAYAPELATALDRHWLRFGHTGGGGEQVHVTDEAATEFKAICRVIVIKDNDRKYLEPIDRSVPEAWPPEQPHVHIWQRLEVENYLPDAVLHATSHPDAETMIYHLRMMTPEQQRWIDMKHGLPKSKPAELYREVDPEARRHWRTGFKHQFQNPLVPVSVVLRVEDFRQLGDDVHDELTQLVQRIRSVA